MSVIHEALRAAEQRAQKAEAALSASIGRLMNAKFDLESGASKAIVIQRLGEYITLSQAALWETINE